MILTVRGRDGQYHIINLRYLLIPFVILMIGTVLTIIGQCYTSKYHAVYDQTYEAITSGKTEIFVPDGNTARNAVLGCAFATPELFGVESVSYAHVDNETMFLFTYNEYAENYEEHLAAYTKMLDEIIKEAPVDGSEHDKALWTHDYLIRHYSYGGSHRAYGMLREGMGVCSAYTQLYMELTSRLGLECRYVLSEPMDHAWNLVKVDGVWYHVDATWDDQAEDTHRYFLLTDSQMLADGHHGWVDLGESSHIIDNLSFWLGKAIWILLAVVLIGCVAPLLWAIFIPSPKKRDTCSKS